MERVLWSVLVSFAVPLLSVLCMMSASPPAAADDADLYEVGTIAQDSYAANVQGPCYMLTPPGITPATWSGFCDGLTARLEFHSFGYHGILGYRELNGTSHQVDVSGYNLGDTADVFVWTGHSYTCDSGGGSGWGGYGDRDKGACLHFMSDHVSGRGCDCCGWDCSNINHDEVRLGANDCEVGIFVTCEFLRNRNNVPLTYSIRSMMQGAHLILGFAAFAYFGTYQHEVGFGNDLAQRLMGRPGIQEPETVVNAWHDACTIYQRDVKDPTVTVVARVLYWNGDCYTDYLLGNFRGYHMGAPPEPYGEATKDHFMETTHTI